MSVYCSVQNIAEWVESTAAQFPNRVAVFDSRGKSIEFGDFWQLSRKVHAFLRRNGVRPGDRVGVLMRKSIDTLIVFQGISRCGAAYVPADPIGPPSRSAALFAHAEVCAIFVDEELADTCERELIPFHIRPALFIVSAEPASGDIWRIESLEGEGGTLLSPVTTSSTALAFLLHTSGSTGRPKATMLTHANVTDFIDWASIQFNISHNDRIALHSPLHFSLPVFNLYAAWKNGAAVVLFDEQSARVPKLVAPLIEQYGITVWFSTPTILSLLLQTEELATEHFSSLRLIMFGGETIPIRDVRSLTSRFSHCKYVHVLGATEAHMISTYEVPRYLSANSTERLPIGKVSSRFRSKVVDEEGRDVVAGGDGELWLAGPGISPGYWGLPAETDRAFRYGSDGQRWYCTGDIVCVHEDGTLVYKGRRDRMLKKHGYRIDLGEIEGCLYLNNAIKEAAVIAVKGEEGEIILKAFVVSRSSERPSIIALKRHCVAHIPLYMIPDSFIYLAALPRTSTGKIDFPRLQ